MVLQRRCRFGVGGGSVTFDSTHHTTSDGNIRYFRSIQTDGTTDKVYQQSHTDAL